MADTETLDAPDAARPATAARIVACVLAGILPAVLFVLSPAELTPGAIVGIAASLGWAAFLYWAMGKFLYSEAQDRPTAVALVLCAIGVALYWGKSAIHPDAVLAGMVGVSAAVLTVTAGWKEVRKAPPTAWFGMVVIFVYIVFSCFAPLLAPFGEEAVVGGGGLPWGAEVNGGTAILGTDKLGRDTLSRLIYGARNTVGIAFLTTVITFVVGTIFGLLAASLHGWIDQLLSRIVDVLMAIPPLIFALLILTVIGTGAWKMVLVIAILDSTRVFRLSRSVALNIVVMDYVEVAKLRGERLVHIIWKEVLPNATAPLAAEFGLRFCFVFLFISALSFLGLGLQPPTADWGSMVREDADMINYFIYDVTSGMRALMPALAIAFLTVAVNFVVDWFLHKMSGLKE